MKSPRGRAALLVSSVALALLTVLAPAPAVAAGTATSTSVVSAPAGLLAVACSGATVCDAVGGNPSNQGVVVLITNGTPGPVQVVPRPDQLSAVACATATTCEAVGSTAGPSGNSEGIIVPITNGTPGTPQVVPQGPLTGVACLSATTCEAVGSDPADGPTVTGYMVTITNGTPGAAEPTNLVLASLTCPTATTCEALGGDGVGDNWVVPIIDGSVEPGIQINNAVMYQPACASDTACVVVGSEGQVDDGLAGVVVPFAGPYNSPGSAQAVSDTAHLYAAACTTTTTCMATGDDGVGGDGVVVPITNGTPGSAQPVPGTTSIFSVACPSATSCVALGDVGDDDGTQTGAVVTIPVAAVTSTAVSCLPASVPVGSPTSCTATVTDAAGAASSPAGTVDFATNLDGSFSPAASCALVAGGAGRASCAVFYTPLLDGGGVHQISASSPASSAFTDLSVTDPLWVPLVPWNLELNPSFEVDTSGWGSYEGSLEQVAAGNAPNGGGVAQVTAGAGAESNGYTLDDWPGAVTYSTAGMTYQGSAWAQGTSASAGQPIELVIRESDSSGQVGSVTSTPVDLTWGGFQQLSVEYTAKHAGDQIDTYLRRPPETIQTGDAFDADVMSLATIPPTNLEPNPSFETDASGWGSWRGSLARVAAANAPDGGWVARVTAGPGAARHGYTLDDWPGAVTDSAAGMTYSGSAWAEGTGASVGQPLELIIRETGSSGAVGSVTSTPVTLTAGSYQQLSVAYTAKAEGDQVDMYLRRPPGAIHPGEQFYADDLTVIPTPSG